LQKTPPIYGGANSELAREVDIKPEILKIFVVNKALSEKT
jgi:hypothetical protein